MLQRFKVRLFQDVKYKTWAWDKGFMVKQSRKWPKVRHSQMYVMFVMQGQRHYNVSRNNFLSLYIQC